MKIPNSFLNELTNTELLVACRLYSAVNARTKLNSRGYEISIKQETIAVSCCLSLSTVKRTLASLEHKGIILHKYRRPNVIGYLGTYRYSLKPFAFLSDYFFMHKRVFTYCLTPKQFKVYALFCKLRCNDISRFYQSYSDLQGLTGIKRSELICLINELISKRLIRRQKKLTRCGDYTDNTYFVVIHQKGKVHKKSVRAFRRSPHTTRIKRFEENSLCRLYHRISFLSMGKRNFFDKIFEKNYSIDGGG